MRDERGLRQVEMRLTCALEGCVLLNLYVIVEQTGSSLKSSVCNASLSSRSTVKSSITYLSPDREYVRLGEGYDAVPCPHLGVVAPQRLLLDVQLGQAIVLLEDELIVGAGHQAAHQLLGLQSTAQVDLTSPQA